MKSTWKIFGFPSGNEFACNAGFEGSVPWVGRSPGEGIGNPLQDSCLGKFHGPRRLMGYSPCGCKELDMT